MQIDPNKYYYHEKYKLLTPVSGYILTNQNSLYGNTEKDYCSYDDDETMTQLDYPIGSVVYILSWKVFGRVKSYLASSDHIYVEILDSPAPGRVFAFPVYQLAKQNESRNRKDFRVGKKVYHIKYRAHKLILESLGFLQNMYKTVFAVTQNNFHEFLVDDEALKNKNLSDADFQVGKNVKFKNKKATIVESNFQNLKNHCVVKLNTPTHKTMHLVHYLNLQLLKK